MEETVRFVGKMSWAINGDIPALIAKMSSVGVSVTHNPLPNDYVEYSIPVHYVSKVMGIQSRVTMPFDAIRKAAYRIEAHYERTRNAAQQQASEAVSST